VARYERVEERNHGSFAASQAKFVLAQGARQARRDLEPADPVEARAHALVIVCPRFVRSVYIMNLSYSRCQADNG
jgi:hypothetical protein